MVDVVDEERRKKKGRENLGRSGNREGKEEMGSMCVVLCWCMGVCLCVYRRTSREEGKEEEKEKGACVVVVAAVPRERVCV